MKTNFFDCLSSFKVEGDWQITIKTGTHSRMLVTVLFKNEKVTDEARKLLPPMVLKGTTQELDEGFFNAIENPVKQTSTLFMNMESYAKALEDAKQKSRMEKDKEQQQKREKESGNKKYESQMKKIIELEAAGKFREAHGQLPKPEDFPDKEEEITTKRKELLEKFEAPSLFNNE